MDISLRQENYCRERSLQNRKHNVDMFSHTDDIYSGVSGNTEAVTLLTKVR